MRHLGMQADGTRSLNNAAALTCSAEGLTCSTGSLMQAVYCWAELLTKGEKVKEGEEGLYWAALANLANRYVTDSKHRKTLFVVAKQDQEAAPFSRH